MTPPCGPVLSGSLLSTPSSVKLLLRARLPPIEPTDPPTGLLTRFSSCPRDSPVVLMSTVFGVSSASVLTLPDASGSSTDSRLEKVSAICVEVVSTAVGALTTSTRSAVCPSSSRTFRFVRELRRTSNEPVAVLKPESSALNV